MGASRPQGAPVSPRRPLIIGHRGFPARFPDNSLAGIRAALEVGADGVEVDVRLCLEGVWVCHHDRTRGGRPVAAIPLAELRAEGNPTLAAVVAELPPTAHLFVEVKPLPIKVLYRAIDPLLRLLEPRLEVTRVLSSSLPVLALMALLLPRLPRSWVVTRVPPRISAGLELSPHHRLVEALLPTGRPLHPWTVNKPERMRALAALGAASITTNRPDRAVEALGA